MAGREAPVSLRRATDAVEQAQADPGPPGHRRTAGPAPGRRRGERAERGPRRVLRATLARVATGSVEPAAGDHRRRPDGTRPEAGAGVQATARRDPRGAARGDGDDEGGGAAVGEEVASWRRVRWHRVRVNHGMAE